MKPKSDICQCTTDGYMIQPANNQFCTKCSSEDGLGESQTVNPTTGACECNNANAELKDGVCTVRYQQESLIMFDLISTRMGQTGNCQI